MCNHIKDEKKKEQCKCCQIVTGACFSVSIILIVTGFLLPPMGAIDGSVLTAVGELLAFPVIVYGFRAIELGLEVKFSKGDASIEISKDDNE